MMHVKHLNDSLYLCLYKFIYYDDSNITHLILLEERTW